MSSVKATAVAMPEAPTRPVRHVSANRFEKASDAFRTISEVSDELEVPQHVLRFWESKFSQIRPLKRGGGRRYYRPEDMQLLRQIKGLLYDQGYTIKGVQRLLKESRLDWGARDGGAGAATIAPMSAKSPELPLFAEKNESKTKAAPKQELLDILGELQDLRQRVQELIS